MPELILRKQPEVCPKCGCIDFEYTRMGEANSVSEKVYCPKCGKTWYNEYDYMRTVISE